MEFAHQPGQQEENVLHGVGGLDDKTAALRVIVRFGGQVPGADFLHHHPAVSHQLNDKLPGFGIVVFQGVQEDQKGGIGSLYHARAEGFQRGISG